MKNLFEHILVHEKGEQQPTYAEWRREFTRRHYGFVAGYGSLANTLETPQFQYKATCQACGHILSYVDIDERTELECPLTGIGFLQEVK